MLDWKYESLWYIDKYPLDRRSSSVEVLRSGGRQTSLSMPPYIKGDVQEYLASGAGNIFNVRARFLGAGRSERRNGTSFYLNQSTPSRVK